MPLSWVRVPNGASPTVRKCMENKPDPTSRKAFDDCVREIVALFTGCKVEDIYYETNGRWARVYFEWSTVVRKNKIVYALGGEDVVDVLTLGDVNKLGP